MHGLPNLKRHICLVEDNKSLLTLFSHKTIEDKAIPVRAWRGLDFSRSMRRLDIMTIGIGRW